MQRGEEKVGKKVASLSPRPTHTHPLPTPLEASYSRRTLRSSAWRMSLTRLRVTLPLPRPTRLALRGRSGAQAGVAGACWCVCHPARWEWGVRQKHATMLPHTRRAPAPAVLHTAELARREEELEVVDELGA
jgi:hypothetical protein